SSPVFAACAAIRRLATSPIESSRATYGAGSSPGDSMGAMTSAAWARLVPGDADAAVRASVKVWRMASRDDQRVEHVQREIGNRGDHQFRSGQLVRRIAAGHSHTA